MASYFFQNAIRLIVIDKAWAYSIITSQTIKQLLIKILKLSMKPLYKLEQDILYNKHKRRLRQIQSKNCQHSNPHLNSQSIQIPSRPWVKQSFIRKSSKQKQKIDEENQKLLDKLLNISTRVHTTNQASTNEKHFKSLQKVKELSPSNRNSECTNPFRKNWLKNIKKQNQDFGDRLVHLRSSLEYSKFSKSIGEYEKVKKSMKLNRQIKLPGFLKNRKKEREHRQKDQEDAEIDLNNIKVILE